MSKRRPSAKVLPVEVDEDLDRQAGHGFAPAFARELPDGRWVYVRFHIFMAASLAVGERGAGFVEDMWVYQDRQPAMANGRSPGLEWSGGARRLVYPLRHRTGSSGRRPQQGVHLA